MKFIAIILLVLSGVAFAGECNGHGGRSGADGGGTNFGHCRGAGCFK